MTNLNNVTERLNSLRGRIQSAAAVTCLLIVLAAASTPLVTSGVAAMPRDGGPTRPIFPGWLPNVHKMRHDACADIAAFRRNSLNVAKIRDAVDAKQRAGGKDESQGGGGGGKKPTADDLNARMRRADDRPSAMGYNMSRRDAHHRIGDGAAPAVPRLLCLGFSHGNKNTDEKQLSAMYKHWAGACDRTLLYTHLSSIENVPPANVREIHPVLGDGENNLWQKIRLAFTLLSDPSVDGPILAAVDFVLIFSDDCVFSLPNLRAHLMEPYVQHAVAAGMPLLLGHRLNDRETSFVSNMGYVMSKQLVRMLGDMLSTPWCDPGAQSSSDDIKFGQCLHAYGFSAYDMYDEAGDSLMMMFEPGYVAHMMQNGFPSWYIGYRGRPVRATPDFISRHPIGVHGVSGEDAIQRMVARMATPW